MYYVFSEFPNVQVDEMARAGWPYWCYVCIMSVCLHFLGSSLEFVIHLVFVPHPPRCHSVFPPHSKGCLIFGISIYRGQLQLSGLSCMPKCSCAHPRVFMVNFQDHGSMCVESLYMHGMWLFSPNTKYIFNKFAYIDHRSYVSQHFRLSMWVSHPSHIISCFL